MDPVAFLQRHPPFDALDDASLERVRAGLEIAYHRAGAVLLQAGGPRSDMLHVIRKGSARVERDGHVVLELEEGDAFGFPSLRSDEPPRFDVVAAQDVLEYRVRADVFRELLSVPAVASFFTRGLAERLRADAGDGGDVLRVPVGSLLTRTLVSVGAETSVRQAAATMTEQGVSCVLVEGGEWGIVTDRDLRRRVLAAGVDPATPVSAVATSPVHTVAAQAPLFEALLVMLERNVHHLPVQRDGALAGVVTATDVLRHQAKAPFYLRGSIDRLTDPARLAGYAGEVTDVVAGMRTAGVEALGIARVVSALTDAVVRALLRVAEQRLGPAPCPFAWLALGSEGRMEQTLLTDQDNALVHADGSGAARAYFAAMADLVVEGLVSAGVPRCPGGVMATNHHGTPQEWSARFESWRATPDPRALMDVAIFFDFRRIAGTLDVAPLQAAVHAAAADGIFLARMAAAALRWRPPIGRFGRVHDSDGTIDVKAAAILPIVALARLFALEAGSDARNTVERLTAANRAGVVSDDGADTLVEAYRFVTDLRLDEQLRARQAGGPATNDVRLAALPARRRRHLKEIFAAVRDQQAAVEQRFSTALGGQL